MNKIRKYIINYYIRINYPKRISIAMKVAFKNINGSNFYYIIFILHFKYTLKKYNNKAI